MQGKKKDHMTYRVYPTDSLPLQKALQWTMAHSLDPKGDERNADYQQIQDVEVVPAEGALVKESPICSHLWEGTKRHKQTFPLVVAQESYLRSYSAGHAQTYVLWEGEDNISNTVTILSKTQVNKMGPHGKEMNWGRER